MQFLEENIYHIYNRGNNKQIIFYKHENYIYFLKKIGKIIAPLCKILAYCLMPNHFHLMAYMPKSQKSSDDYYALNNAIAVLLRSYTRAINIQENRTGSLFQQKTKAKCLTEPSNNPKPSDEFYPLVCFHYIHQNPLTAGLVQKIEDWEFSSFRYYVGFKKSSDDYATLCNKKLAVELLNLDINNLYNESYDIISPEKIKVIG